MAIPEILFQNYFKVPKILWLFLQPYKEFTDIAVLEVWTSGRFQNRICIVSNHNISMPGRKTRFYNDR